MTRATTLKVKELGLKNTLLHAHFKMGHLEQMPYEEMLENTVISLVEKQELQEDKLVKNALLKCQHCNDTGIDKREPHTCACDCKAGGGLVEGWANEVLIDGLRGNLDHLYNKNNEITHENEQLKATLKDVKNCLLCKPISDEFTVIERSLVLIDEQL